MTYSNTSPSRLDYLNKTVALRIPATTTATDCVLSTGPQAGQYWMPKVIRIAMSSDTVVDTTTGSTPTALLFYGGPQTSKLGNVTPDPGILLDSTRNGCRDATGIASGMVISPGEALTVVWRNLFHAVDTTGKAMDATAYLQILGTVSTLPPSDVTQFLPEVMGPRFSSAALADTNYTPSFVEPIAFDNPGPGASVAVTQLLQSGDTKGVRLQDLYITWSANSASGGQVSGSWILWNSSVHATQQTVGFDIYQPAPRLCSFRGLPLTALAVGSPQLAWKQDPACADVAGSIVGVGYLTYSPFTAP